MRTLLACSLVLAMVIFAVFPSGPLTSAQSSVLTSSGGPGISAQISNYSLDGGQFCFTVANSSIQPVTIGAIGFSLNGAVMPTGLTQVGTSEFFLQLGPTFDFTGAHLTADFAVTSYIDEDTLAGIRPSESASFCVAGDFGTLTADQIARSLGIIFLGVNKRQLANEGQCGVGASFEPSFVDGYNATVWLNAVSANEYCFQITNTSQEVITGIGFDLPGEGGTYSLQSITPANPPASADLIFTSSPGPVPQFNRISFVPQGAIGHYSPPPQFSPRMLDFALTTGRNFAGGSPQAGLQPGETSPTYCIAGDFSNLLGEDLEVSGPSGEAFLTNHIFVRFQGSTQVAACSGGSGSGSLAARAGSRPE